MAYILELPDALYTALKEAAEARGLTPVDWIAANLPSARKKEPMEIEKSSTTVTLADRFAGRLGHIRSGGKESLSENSRDKFAAYLEEKRKAGHL
jgi:hypothetical protein